MDVNYIYDWDDAQIREMFIKNHFPSTLDVYGLDDPPIMCRRCGEDWPCKVKMEFDLWQANQ